MMNNTSSTALGTVLIMAGGTGGHVFPALAIARNLQQRGYRTEWLGTPSGIEVQVLGGTDIPLHCIEARGLRGKNLLSLLLAPFMIVNAVLQAVRVVREVKPCCVLGMGGYVTGPGGVAAKLLGKPLLIHEQNAIAGFSNRLLARIADIVMEAFPGTFAASVKALCTGNPVRKEISAIGSSTNAENETRTSLRVLVFGGSLGAVAINKIVPDALALLAGESELEVRHQAGRKNVEQTQIAYAERGLDSNDRYQVLAFIDDMAAAYLWADLVICRAGAMTVSELAAAGRASILVPFPFAVDDHQTKNAQSLSEIGGAVLIQQDQLNGSRLAELIRGFLVNRDELKTMALKAKSSARLDASDVVANECIGVC